MSSASAQQIGRMFSSPVVRSLTHGSGAHASVLFRKAISGVTSKSDSLEVERIYSAAYKKLAREIPGEYVYKSALLQRYVFGKTGSARSRVFFEYRCGSSKLDALVVHDSIDAFEIKTELDQLKRLASQLSDYKHRFEKIWVFVSEKHASRVESIVDSKVGIAMMTKRVSFDVLREAVIDRKFLRSEKILETLRRNEYVSVLRRLGYESVGLPNTEIFRHAMSFAKKLSPIEVLKQTRSELSNRPCHSSAKDLRRLPYFLRAAAVASQLNCDELDMLVDTLSSRVRIKREQ